MSNRSLPKLVLLTLLISVAAFVTVRLRQPPPAPPEAGPALPSLVDRVNDVARITIQRASASTSLVRIAEGDGVKWTLPDRDGFPADPDRVRERLLQLRDLRLREAKTSNPEFYARLGVQDVKQGDSSSPRTTLVTLFDGAGKDLGSLILGDTADLGTPSPDRPPVPGQYVRRPGELQSWLADGSVWMDSEPMNWVDRRVVSIPRERLRSATMHRLRAAGPAEPGATPDLKISRPDPGVATFEVADMPAGSSFKPNQVPDQIISPLAFLSMEEVRKDPGTVVGQSDPEAAGDQAAVPASVVYETFDGVRVRVSTGFADGRWWASVHAEPNGEVFVPAAVPEGESEAARSERESADAARSARFTSAATEMERLNARVKGWLFAIPQFEARRLSASLEDLLAPPTPTEPAPPVGPAQPGSLPEGSPLPPPPAGQP